MSRRAPESCSSPGRIAEVEVDLHLLRDLSEALYTDTASTSPRTTRAGCHSNGLPTDARTQTPIRGAQQPVVVVVVAPIVMPPWAISGGGGAALPIVPPPSIGRSLPPVQTGQLFVSATLDGSATVAPSTGAISFAVSVSANQPGHRPSPGRSECASWRNQFDPVAGW
jgi:hypothetical protein